MTTKPRTFEEIFEEVSDNPKYQDLKNWHAIYCVSAEIYKDEALAWILAIKDGEDPETTLLITAKGSTQLLLSNGSEHKPVLFTSEEGLPVYDGDKYYTFNSEDKTKGGTCIASKATDYSEYRERFSTEDGLREAIEVFKWLNNGKEK